MKEYSDYIYVIRIPSEKGDNFTKYVTREGNLYYDLDMAAYSPHRSEMEDLYIKRCVGETGRENAEIIKFKRILKEVEE